MKTKNEKAEKLNKSIEDWGCTRKLALLVLIYAHYFDKGFEIDELSKKYKTMSVKELEEVYYNL